MTSPVPAQTICESVLHRNEDPCHSGKDLESHPGEIDTGESSYPDDCCDSGCLDCGLPCCTGLTMILVSSPATISHGCVGTQAFPHAIDLPCMDPDPLFHPPRA